MRGRMSTKKKLCRKGLVDVVGHQPLTGRLARERWRIIRSLGIRQGPDTHSPRSGGMSLARSFKAGNGIARHPARRGSDE